MALPETFSLRALSQGQRALPAHRRAHKYQLVVFDNLAAVVLTVAEGDFVAAVEVLVSVVPVGPPVGLAVLWAEIKLFITSSLECNAATAIYGVLEVEHFLLCWRDSTFAFVTT